MPRTDITTELYYSGDWHTVPVFTRDPIVVTRGRPNKSQMSPPSQASHSIDNRTYAYSTRRPTSALYGLIGRNTPIRTYVSGHDVIADSFNRISTAGLGKSELGAVTFADTGAGGSVLSSDFQVSDLTASHFIPTTSAFRISYLDHVDVNLADVAVTVRLRALDGTSSDILGNDIEGGLMLRVQDVNTYYHPRVEFNADQSITASLHAVGGTGSLGSATPAAAITYAGQWLVLKAQCTGTTVRMKVWEDGDPEPAAWDVSVTNTEFTTAGGVGMRSGVASANTNTSRTVYYRALTLDRAYRHWGEVESWPQRSNVAGTDVWVPITSYGITRRLNAPGVKAPVLSALRRAYRSTGSLAAGLLAYWPFEDGESATQAASALAGVAALTLTSAVSPAGVSAPQAGSAPYALLDNTGAAFTIVTLPSAAAGFFAFSAVVKGTMPLPTTARAVIYNLATFGLGGDITQAQITAYAKWTGTAFDTTNTGLDVVLTGGTSFGSVVGAVANVNLFDGNPHDVQVRLAQSGADVVGQLWVDGVMVDDATSATKTLGAAATMQAPAAASGSLGGTAADNTDTTLGFGHYAINTNSSVSKPHDAATGHVGELAADRIERLCDEDGVAVTILGDPSETASMGVQRVAPFLALVDDAVDADGGIRYEPRTFLGLAYRTLQSLYNQTHTLELDYAAGGEVAPPLNPVEDLDATVNDVTVTRYLGSSSNAVQEAGPLNVQDPTDDPQGVGRIAKEFVLVLATDAQATSQATWRLHLGTSDDVRCPAVTLDLTAMIVEGKTALVADAASLDVGGLFNISNPPDELPPDTIEQLAQGFTETLDEHHWKLVANAVPAVAYEVWQAETGSGNRSRIPPAAGATTTTEALDTTETGIDIVSATVRWIDSAAYPSHFPFDIMIGGERMTVTAIAGTVLAQTMTVTRSVNGVVKSHASGVEVQLFRPPVIAL